MEASQHTRLQNFTLGNFICGNPETSMKRKLIAGEMSFFFFQQVAPQWRLWRQPRYTLCSWTPCAAASCYATERNSSLRLWCCLYFSGWLSSCAGYIYSWWTSLDWQKFTFDKVNRLLRGIEVLKHFTITRITCIELFSCIS